MSEEAGQNLVSAIGSFLPDTMTSGQVFGAAGIALATVIGGAYALSNTSLLRRKYKPSKVVIPVLMPLTRRQTFAPSDLNSTSHANLLINDYTGDAETGDQNVEPPFVPNIDSVLILHNWPRGRKTPCISPFPLKLETFLRVYGVKYDVDFHTKGPTKVPWITIGVEDVIDSQNCIRFICEKFDIYPDEKIDLVLESQGRAYLHMLENHLYWGITLDRWVFGEAKNLKDIQFLPEVSRDRVPGVSKAIAKCAWHHGIGKLDSKGVIAELMVDLESLSDLLGDKMFMLSEAYPSELDCTAFGMLAQMIWNMEGSPYLEAIQESFPNLEAFTWRIRNDFWPDWNICLNDIPYDRTPEEEDDDDYEGPPRHYY